MHRLYLIPLALILASGCVSTNKGKGTSSNLVEADIVWREVLACSSIQDNSTFERAIVIDVRDDERSELQAVVRDPRLFAYFDSTMPWGQLPIVNSNERIYRGQTTRGVFDSSSFENVFNFAYDANGRQYGFEARRYNDVLVFRALDFIARNCGGSLRSNNYELCESANYVFKECRQTR